MSHRSARPRLVSCSAAILLLAPVTLAAQAAGSVTKVELKAPAGGAAYCENTRCWIAKGSSALLTVHGLGIAQAGFVADNSGSLETSLTGLKALGRTEVSVSADATGSRGEKTVKVQYKVGSNVLTEWTFPVVIIDAGTVASLTPPKPTDFFSEATVAVLGNELANARVSFVSVFGTPAPATSITSQSSSQVGVKLTWPAPQSNVAVALRLCDKLLPTSACQNYFPSFGQAQGTIAGPPAIKSITFAPPVAKVGDDLTITFELTSAARAATVSGPSRMTGESIWWKLSSPADFEPVTGSCAYVSTGVTNKTTVAPGNSLMSCKVRVVSAAGMGPVTRTIETWVANPSRTDPPYYKAQQFSIKSM